MVCKKCNHEVLDGARFCGTCGAKIEEELDVVEENTTDTSEEAVIIEIIKCKNCGDVVGPDEKFCNKCGSKIELEETLESTEEVVENLEDDDQEVESLEESKKRCPGCGDEVEESEAFCNKCGMNLKQEEVVKKTCPACGDEVDEGETFCNKCGYNLNQSISSVSQTAPVVEKKTPVWPFIVGTGLCLAIMIGCLVGLLNSNSKVYISDEVEDEEIVTAKNSNANPKGKYNTIIVSENEYEGVKLTSKKDVVELIKKDSVQQKKNCPDAILQYENELINTYGITAVNLCELDVEFAKELVNVTKKVYDEYPVAKGTLTNLTVIDVSKADGYIAAFQSFFPFASSSSDTTYPWGVKTRIMLNTGYYFNKDRFENGIKSSVSSGHFPKNATIYSPLAHEYAHYLSFLAAMKHFEVDSFAFTDQNNIEEVYELIYGRRGHSYNMIETAYNKCKSETGLTLGIDEWRATISGYAVAKDNEGEYIYDETIAEAFHDVYLNGDSAASASIYVTNELKRRLGGDAQ